METDIEKFKKRVINSSSRNVGEGFVQRIFYKIYGHKPSLDGSYDALDGDEKLEYKSVRALFPPNKTKKTMSLYDEFMDPTELYDRLGKVSDIENDGIKVNIQNVKPHTFDQLIYVIISDDGFDVYKMMKSELEDRVALKEFPNWSEHHGREEAGGRNCQFPITSKNIGWHEKKDVYF